MVGYGLNPQAPFVLLSLQWPGELLSSEVFSLLCPEQLILWLHTVKAEAAEGAHTEHH